MIKDARIFRNKHKGETIWVVGSGATLKHIDPSFFADKIAIGMNKVPATIPCSYAICCDYPFIVDSCKYNLPTFTPRTCRRVIRSFTIEEWLWHINEPEPKNLYSFRHPPHYYDGTAFSLPNDGEVGVGTTVAVSAVSLAAYMGAKTIILCGVDLGELDGEQNLDGYYSTPNPGRYNVFYDQIRATVKFLREHGVNVYSLNPFINLGLEGHTFHG